MTYSTDPAYQLLFEHSEGKVYFLKDNNLQKLHKSREVEANIQNIYSNAGATAEYIGALCEEGMKMLENDQKNDQLRQNMMNILGELRYRTKYPVDNLCAIRMGAILSFIDGEPEEIEWAWIDKKIRMAMRYPEAYSFFLTWGIVSTPSYSNRLNILSDPDYFHKRHQKLIEMNQLQTGSNRFTIIYPNPASNEPTETSG